jgi:hypothetical protein
VANQGISRCFALRSLFMGRKLIMQMSLWLQLGSIQTQSTWLRCQTMKIEGVQLFHFHLSLFLFYDVLSSRGCVGFQCYSDANMSTPLPHRMDACSCWMYFPM